MRNKSTALIITSISGPNEGMKAFAQGCKKRGIDFIVVGDMKSPENFQLDGCRFISIGEQRQLPYKIAKLLPDNHYSRKNLGYLLARDKDIILETDDDNLPREEFWNKELSYNNARVVDKKGWVNTYEMFSDKPIWPRGFPLEELQHSRIGDKDMSASGKMYDIAIYQGLADENPDVDAVYRMTSTLPLNFEKNPPVILAPGTWCPFNSQNTTWKREAFPLLYLPSYCSFRMTDIWRSFVAQRIAWTCGWSVLFHAADVWQERNEHNLLKDFADEVPGYLNNFQMCRMLDALDLKSGRDNICENLIRCYRLLVENSWVGKEEMKLVEAWCGEF